MTALALRLILGAASGAAPPPPPVVFSRAVELELYRECLEEHDLTADENDGECEEP